MMTAEEKYLFDLHGFIVVRNAVPAADVNRMVELCDAWHALPDAKLPPPLRSYDEKSRKPTDPRSINHIEYADEVFQRLVLNVNIMRIVLALTGDCPQLIDTALTRNTRETIDIPFHGGVSGGFHNPANQYQSVGDRCFATFINAATSLVDVPQGSGFVCVPGSHKAHFERPAHITNLSDPPTVVNVCPKAGDTVIFTETLCHGARGWNADGARRTAFIRYCTSYASWTPGHGPMEEHKDKISEEVYELHQVQGHGGGKRVTKRLLKEIEGK
ncbi:MAG: phytanoyl-CoA dioxygenase family protein [Planctomycetota bacterium]|nr:phytanoyl-CoA dioxygenase family protein [Planctomycetota bacterium]